MSLHYLGQPSLPALFEQLTAIPLRSLSLSTAAGRAGKAMPFLTSSAMGPGRNFNSGWGSLALSAGFMVTWVVRHSLFVETVLIPTTLSAGATWKVNTHLAPSNLFL